MFPNVIPQGFPVVICATLQGGLRPNYTTGYECKVCQKQLQVSAAGLRLIRERGGWTFCQYCGIPIFTKLQEIKDKVSGIGFTPDALATLAKSIDTMSKQEGVKPGDVAHWMKMFEELIGSLK